MTQKEYEDGAVVEMVSARRYYAAKAMQALIQVHGNGYLWETCRDAFKFADAMLEVERQAKDGSS
jgi:hypothetical protein